MIQSQSQSLNMDGFQKVDLSELIQTPNNISAANYGTGILLVEPHTHKILMAARKDNGLLATPGGKVEFGESPLMGIVRETLEESNVKVNSAYCYGTNQHTAPDGTPWIDFMFISHDFDASDIKPQSLEMGEYMWYDTSVLSKENLFPPCEAAIRKAILRGQLPLDGMQDELKYVAIDTSSLVSPCHDSAHCCYSATSRGNVWLPWD